MKKINKKNVLTVLDAGFIFASNLPLPPTAAAGGDAVDASL